MLAAFYPNILRPTLKVKCMRPTFTVEQLSQSSFSLVLFADGLGIPIRRSKPKASFTLQSMRTSHRLHFQPIHQQIRKNWKTRPPPGAAQSSLPEVLSCTLFTLCSEDGWPDAKARFCRKETRRGIVGMDYYGIRILSFKFYTRGVRYLRLSL